MSSYDPEIRRAARQQQFLDVIGRDEAAARFRQHLTLTPSWAETVPLAAALNRSLAVDVAAPVDVPGFDRSNVDGFAVRSADTFGALEEHPRRVRLTDEILAPGDEPCLRVEPGTATTIATGAMVPRGADAVVMVEDTEVVEDESGRLVLEIRRAASPGQNVTFAGTDIALGETVLRAGQLITSREVGVLAALGMAEVAVVRRPRVAVLSTGNEIVPPGGPCPAGSVYDSNLAILCAAVVECGGEPVPLGVVPDDEPRLRAALDAALKHDVVILSGGTSKGAGDLSYRVVAERLQPPGIVAHGVALKPGKPVCLAVSAGKPVAILPGFPTSAIFTFHEFIAPVIRALAGQPEQPRERVAATLPMRLNSERGRTEYVLVSLVRGEEGLAAYPMGKGSGSVTSFSHADGFLAIDPQTEILEAGAPVEVHLLAQRVQPADLVVIGSHCVGLDLILGQLRQRGFTSKALHVGSMGGLAAAKRGECDIAGVHLMDPQSGEYNTPFLSPGLELVRGYRRMQGLVYRPDDARLAGRSAAEALAAVLADTDCVLVNRNAGSGTRILIDRLLGGARPPGYAVQAKSHNAVAAAVAQGRADWGIAIETVARLYGLGFIPVQDEHYDFVTPRARRGRPAVRAFCDSLRDPDVVEQLKSRGFSPDDGRAI